MKKLVIGLTQISQAWIMGLQHKYIGLHPLKETTANAKEKSKLLFKTKAKTYYGLRIIAKKKIFNFD